jgi:N-acetylglucosaminyldiphosphoundecaprenol N-acetyl-beta-D-mannosaminyltransferase
MESFLGIPLCTATKTHFIESLTSVADNGPTIKVAYLNAWTTVMAANQPTFARRLRDDMEVVYADGMGVVWGARFLGISIPERINAADFILEFLLQCAQKNLKIFLFGGRDGVASKAATQWQCCNPALQIVGTAAGYGIEGGEVARQVRAAGADIVLVGLGSPLQEDWAATHGHQCGARVVWCIGAMMDYHSGSTARAPVWMRKMGLEWLFRLLVEPRRLWKRYLLGNLRFLQVVITRRTLVDYSE